MPQIFTTYFRKASLFVLLTTLITSQLFAQQCENGISTDPTNPVSPYPFSTGTNNPLLRVCHPEALKSINF
jgi:hypothetical protein